MTQTQQIAELRRRIELNKSGEPIDRHRCFLMATLCLGFVCTLLGEEKQYSARWNRARSAEEAMLRLCDIYLPNGIDQARLVSIWDVIDGPVNAVISRHAGMLLDAVDAVEVSHEMP